jgi:hypothetical protein
MVEANRSRWLEHGLWERDYKKMSGKREVGSRS